MYFRATTAKDHATNTITDTTIELRWMWTCTAVHVATTNATETRVSSGNKKQPHQGPHDAESIVHAAFRLVQHETVGTAHQYSHGHARCWYARHLDDLPFQYATSTSTGNEVRGGGGSW